MRGREIKVANEGARLAGAVFAAVHHAEVVAHRVGEPFGTLVLALAVTAIETALILSMMLAGGDDMATLPRDAIYAAVMLISTGVVGICVWTGGLAHREQTFRVEGAGAGLPRGLEDRGSATDDVAGLVHDIGFDEDQGLAGPHHPARWPARLWCDGHRVRRRR